MSDAIRLVTDELLIYKTPNGSVKVEMYLKDENLWLPQARIAELFGVNRPAVTKHLKNIFGSGELQENSVSSILEHTAKDGKAYKTKFYNLDAIISVGYRVNSKQATHFRIWATERLKEYIIKGFTMDDERLKAARTMFGTDYEPTRHCEYLKCSLIISQSHISNCDNFDTTRLPRQILFL